MQGGRGVFSDRRKGKIPFQTLKMLIIGVLPFLVLNFCGLSKNTLEMVVLVSFTAVKIRLIFAEKQLYEQLYYKCDGKPPDERQGAETGA